MHDIPKEKRRALVELSHFLGSEPRALAILGEGNTSARIDGDTFLVKASGSSLGTLGKDDVVACRTGPLLGMLESDGISDQQIEDELFASRLDASAKKPSVEALFHAYLLSLPGIGWVGHAHPVGVNAILCSPRARDFAEHRIFPDEVVCCGPASVLVPYTDPGLKLARAIRDGVGQYMSHFNTPPRVILLESHGVITLGATPQAVQAAMLMTDKAARIFAGASALGGPVFMSAEDVDRIANRIDEHYRQKALRL